MSDVQTTHWEGCWKTGEKKHAGCEEAQKGCGNHSHGHPLHLCKPKLDDKTRRGREFAPDKSAGCGHRFDCCVLGCRCECHPENLVPAPALPVPVPAAPRLDVRRVGQEAQEPVLRGRSRMAEEVKRCACSEWATCPEHQAMVANLHAPAPAPSATITYACQFCRVLEPEEHKPDCFVFTVTALRAEVERLRIKIKNYEPVDTYNGCTIEEWKAEAERLSREAQMWDREAMKERARADKAEAEVEELRKDHRSCPICHGDPSTFRAGNEGYGEEDFDINSCPETKWRDGRLVNHCHERCLRVTTEAQRDALLKAMREIEVCLSRWDTQVTEAKLIAAAALASTDEGREGK